MMKRLAAAFAAAALLAALAAAPASGAPYGLHGLGLSFEGADGSPLTQAGSHPFAFTTTLDVDTEIDPDFGEVPAGTTKQLTVDLPPGLAVNPSATPRCSAADFWTSVSGLGGNFYTACPDSTAVGLTTLRLGRTGAVGFKHVAVYNLQPPPGVAAAFGFNAEGVRVTVFGGARQQSPNNLFASVPNISQILVFFGSQLTLWGNPADPAHDPYRGRCLKTETDPPEEPGSEGECPVDIPERALVTLPTSCQGPLATNFSATAWVSGEHFEEEALTPPGMSGCAVLHFAPEISAQPTSRSAASPSGLDFDLELADEGLANPDGLASSHVKKAVVTLPEGVAINPSQAEGLGVCSRAEYTRETARSEPGDGCPGASKIGTVSVRTPLLEEALEGSLYVAEPYRNPTGSLIAVYMVIRDRERGVLVKRPIEVSPDPASGQLIGTLEDGPQVPFSRFHLHFREGGRSPLITPPGCGRYATTAKLYPWSTPASPHEVRASFQISSGPGGGRCPGSPPFAPDFSAGTLNNAAGSYSPFVMRLTRQDAEQDLSRFSAVLPRGVVGRIAGIPWCPESGIARARSRSGEHGGEAELNDPSCPAASQIGRTVAGAGVGNQLTYVPGSLYLAGPYHGDPLSVVSITPALAGPFDAGTVVVRDALTLNPITAQVQVDGTASDPIPHILQGIPLNLRDLRVYTDRPAFTLNATSCTPSATLATLWGAGTVLAPSGDVPVGLAARYQAAGCAALGFKPKLGIKLKGGVKRGAHPALKAVVTPRPGDANISGAVVRLPRSAFLDQAHIRTVCTRVQFAAGAGNGAACPPGAVYGHATAWSPLLAQPLSGPVYLRSSSHKLPDLIVALHGQFDLNLGARIDSVKGGIRTTFAGIPDAPVSRFILRMQGGKKGLIVNSKYLCRKRKRNRARANIRAQNGRKRTLKPVVRAVKCKKHRKRKGGKGQRKRSGHN